MLENQMVDMMVAYSVVLLVVELASLLVGLLAFLMAVKSVVVTESQLLLIASSHDCCYC